MPVNPKEIKDLANRLAANVRLKTDYKTFLNKERKLLVVEGSTDEKFVERVKCDNVDCMSANKVFRNNAAFRTTPPAATINCKDAIVALIRGISICPSPFIQYPDDVDKWDVYGLVDLDCDELAGGKPTPRLFVTDTHDLETLLLSTDSNVLKNIDNCKIPDEDVRKALFMATQLASARDLLHPYHNSEDFRLNAISCGSYEVGFGQFFTDCRVNLYELIKYIAAQSGNDLTPPKIKRIYDSVRNSKPGRKLFTADGIWKKEIGEFDVTREVSWETINGHDILQLLGYLNESVGLAFYQGYKGDINREFEISLINAYDCQNFKKTKLYEKMEKEKIVLSIA